MTTQSNESPTPLKGRAQRPGLSQPVRRAIGLTLTYIMLGIGAAFMFFPMLWMLTASLKPEWQILTEPISIPSEWIHVRAGDTIQEIPTWYATDPDGQRDEVIEIGVRRYTTVLDAAKLPELLVVPGDQLGDAQPASVGGAVLNVRIWTQDDGTTRQVVALARAGDSMVIAPVEALVGAATRMALADVNAGRRTQVEIQDYSLQGREIDDQGLTVVPIGPESQLTIVAPRSVASQAVLVSADAIGEAEFVPIGDTELQHFPVEGKPDDEFYVLLSSETWQPVIELDTLNGQGLVADNDQLSPDTEVRYFNLAPMQVTQLTQSDGTQIEVVVLLRSSLRSLVIPVANSDTIRLSPLSKLAEPFVENVQSMAVRYRDDFVEYGERHSVAIVGDRLDMSLVIHETAITEAFDVPSESLERVRRLRFYVENYADAMGRDLGGATFVTFYGNSTLLVILNLLGHFLSITLVAYGFARLRAPGKRILFLILLSTMMLPWPVMLIPQYEIFQKLDMVNTLWPLFIRSFFGNAFLIFLLRQFFMSIPQELEDAARIDGANTLQVLWHVMLPLSKPALATIGIFTFWWTWNSYFEPFVYLSSVRNFTVSLGLGFFKNQYAYNFRLLMSASVIAILPIITIFFFAQRYFIEGIQLTGLKG